MVSARRRGMGRLGCLFSLLLLAAIGYFGLPVAEAYYRYYRLRDAMAQELRFGDVRGDDEIRRRLVAVVDSLGLPSAASRFTIRREATRMTIQTSYHEVIELPMTVRDLAFTPRVERSF